MDPAVHFSVGARVVHPSHGAGVIVGVQGKQIGEIKNRYYIIDMHDMRVMVPVKRAATAGLRSVGREARIRRALAHCQERLADDQVIRDYRQRKAALLEKLNSGEFSQWISAVRVLHCLSERRPLGTNDLQMYKRGMDILASELALASSTEFDDARQEIEALLDCATEQPNAA